MEGRHDAWYVIRDVPEPADSTATRVLKVDDDAVEVLQLGVGMLVGVALAGAGMVASRRGHAHAARPA